MKVREGDRSRVQAYEGVVIARDGGGLNESFTVRKISYGEGVERVFPDPRAADRQHQGRAPRKVRRAKLYYLRDRRGKSARIAERIDTKPKADKPEPLSASRLSPARVARRRAVFFCPGAVAMDSSAAVIASEAKQSRATS